MGYAQPPLGPYNYHEVLSALRKEIKLNRPEDAIYWANVILTFGEKAGPATLAKQLWIMAAEDIDDPMIVLRAFAVFQMVKTVPESDHLFYLVGAMCKARKWWEHEDGREVDSLWAKAIGDLSVAERNKPIPSYALDRHTRRGWAIFKKNGDFDDRYSGTELGRQKTVYLFRRDGQIGPDSKLDAGFWGFWRNRRLYQAIRAEHCEPNDLTKDDEELNARIGLTGGHLFEVSEPQDDDEA